MGKISSISFLRGRCSNFFRFVWIFARGAYLASCALPPALRATSLVNEGGFKGPLDFEGAVSEANWGRPLQPVLYNCTTPPSPVARKTRNAGRRGRRPLRYGQAIKNCLAERKNSSPLGASPVFTNTLCKFFLKPARKIADLACICLLNTVQSIYQCYIIILSL